jgi:hypothetical protein
MIEIVGIDDAPIKHLLGRRCDMMTKDQLERKIALLESVNDQLVTEVAYIDKLMRLIGFSDGLRTIKNTAQELIKHPEWRYENEEELD